MDKQKAKWVRRRRRRLSARRRIEGTPDRPRLAIYRSSKHIYAQVIDDLRGHTLASASTLSESPSGAGVDKAQSVGKAIAEKAKAAGVTQVVFDRGGCRYHGRIKALADAARQGGLNF
jgi:large subunit ribosomal protein L18